MKTTKKMIEVMVAHDNGADIEYKRNDSITWNIATTPTWDWITYDFRIKEQKKTVTIEKWLLKTKDKELYCEYASNNIDIYIFNSGLEKIKLLETYEVEL